jgi:hypothetical protein
LCWLRSVETVSGNVVWLLLFHRLIAILLWRGGFEGDWGADLLRQAILLKDVQFENNENVFILDEVGLEAGQTADVALLQLAFGDEVVQFCARVSAFFSSDRCRYHDIREPSMPCMKLMPSLITTRQRSCPL